MRTYYVYMLASAEKKNGVLYIGVTNDLARRMFEHKNGLIDGFTKKYHVKYLVYCEETESIDDAIKREKQLKGWSRKKKNALIEDSNPHWMDLSSSFRLFTE